MLGIIFGTICLISLISMVKRGHRRHHYGPPWAQDHGYGDHCSRGGGEGWDYRDGGHNEDAPRRRGRRGRSGGFRGRAMGYVFDELQTSPSQERVVGEAMEELFAKRKDFKATVGKLRENLGGAFRDPDLDVDKLGAAFAQYDELARDGRETMTDTLTKVHAVLDDEQRRRLARVIESGPGAFMGMGRGERGRSWANGWGR